MTQTPIGLLLLKAYISLQLTSGMPRIQEALPGFGRAIYMENSSLKTTAGGLLALDTVFIVGDN